MCETCSSLSIRHYVRQASDVLTWTESMFILFSQERPRISLHARCVVITFCVVECIADRHDLHAGIKAWLSTPGQSQAINGRSCRTARTTACKCPHSCPTAQPTQFWWAGPLEIPLSSASWSKPGTSTHCRAGPQPATHSLWGFAAPAQWACGRPWGRFRWGTHRAPQPCRKWPCRSGCPGGWSWEKPLPSSPEATPWERHPAAGGTHLAWSDPTHFTRQSVKPWSNAAAVPPPTHCCIWRPPTRTPAVPPPASLTFRCNCWPAWIYSRPTPIFAVLQEPTSGPPYGSTQSGSSPHCRPHCYPFWATHCNAGTPISTGSGGCWRTGTPYGCAQTPLWFAELRGCRAAAGGSTAWPTHFAATPTRTSWLGQDALGAIHSWAVPAAAAAVLVTPHRPQFS